MNLTKHLSKIAPKRNFSESKKASAEYSGYKFTLPQFIRYLSAGALLGALVCWLCYHSIYSAPLAAVIAYIYIKKKRKELAEKRRRTLLYHFKDFLGAVYTASRSGYAIENAIMSANEDMKQLYGEQDVIVQEINTVIYGLKFRKSADTLFRELGERSGLEDIRLFAELLAIGKRMGGGMGKILTDTRRIISEKIETEQEISEQLASRKYEQKIMSIVPAAVILYLRLTFNGFIEQLYGNAAGVLIMTCALAVYTAAYFLGMKLVRIEV